MSFRPSRTDDASLPPGALAAPRIADRYAVLSLLGVGGMGSVYRVRDEALDEIVALKMLRRELVDRDTERTRFRQEVKLARRVAHPNVARVFDLGEADGDVYLTMEYIEGETLAHRLLREAPLPTAELATLGGALCEGLAAVHAAGVVHRDFKPENVLLGREGRIALTDFGIARASSRAAALVHTQGLVVGTPDYMAPEQVEETPDLDARADIYALGVVLFEAATGRRPFNAPTPLATAIARLTQAPPDPRSVRPGLGDALADLIWACIQRDRAARPQTVTEVAAALRSLGGGGQTLVLIPPPSATRALPSPAALPAPTLPQARPGEKRVAVLPFRDLSGAAAGPGAADAYLADGLTDDISDTLAGLPGLRVRPRSTVARAAAAPEHADALAVGRALEVDVVVEGSVRRAGDRLRIQARVLNVVDGFAVWGQRFDGAVSEAFPLCDQVARGIAGALTTDLARERTPVNDAEVVDLYMRGRAAYHRLWRNSTRESVALLQQAAERAPENTTVLAAYALALGRAIAVDSADVRTAERLQAICDRLIALDAKLAAPRLALAMLRFQLGDPLGAALDLRHALILSPDHPDARELLGRILVEAGQIDAGIGQLQVARTLEPAMALARLTILRGEELRGRHDIVDAALRTGELVGVDQNLVWAHRARSVCWRRDREAARRDLDELLQTDVELRSAAVGTYQAVLDPKLADHACEVLDAQFMDRPDMSARLRSFFAQLKAEFLALGDRRGPCIGAIDEAYANGLIDISWLDLCPLFRGMERDPAFVATRERVRARANGVLQALNGG